jgi:hypothetical protein
MSDKKTDIVTIFLLLLCVFLSFGLIHTRGLQEDDFCMGRLANSTNLIQGMKYWLHIWNGRLTLSFFQLLMYKIPLFQDPLHGKWIVYHALALLGHMLVTTFIYSVLRRFDFSNLASLCAAALFGIHPIVMQPVMWLSVGFGYVLGTCFFLLGIFLLLLERENPNWRYILGAGIFLSLACLTIEQFIVVLAALSLANLTFVKRRYIFRQGLLPLLLCGFIGTLTLVVHFLLTTGTIERISKHAGKAQTLKEFLWFLAWRLNPLPEHSPFGELFYPGLRSVINTRFILFGIAVAFGTLYIILRKAAISSAHEGLSRRCIISGVIGASVFISSTGIFVLSGSYGMPARALYLPLIGLSLLVAAFAEGILTKIRLGKQIVICALLPFMFFSIVTNWGGQIFYAKSWELHKDVMKALQDKSDPILRAGCVEVNGLPKPPMGGEISHLGSSFAFPCMIEWLYKKEGIKGCTNLMRQIDSDKCAQNCYSISVQ